MLLGLALTFAFTQGCDQRQRARDESVGVTVHFREDAPSVAMVAFFEGFNVGSLGTDGGAASRFNLNTRERRMTLEFRRSDAVDYFTFVAERSEIVESVDPPGTV